MEPLAEYKNIARGLWAAGDYDLMASTEGLYATGDHLVRTAGISRADHVLDVACGTGNATLPAAATGATVTGLDLAPAMLTAAAKRAAGAGLTIEWQEGDAEDLPFGDGGFDVVLSAFGAMWAPRHEVVAGELARVLRSGGRLALASWAPEGSMAEFFSTVAGFAEPAPDFADPPLLWGSEAHVRELFEGTGVDLEFRRAEVMLLPRRKPTRSSCTPPSSARWPPPVRPPRPTAGGPRCVTRSPRSSSGTTPGTTGWPGPRRTSSSPAASAADPIGRQGRETGMWRL